MHVVVGSWLMQTGARTALRSERRLADRPLALPADGHRQPEALDVAFGLLERDRLHPFAVLQLDCGPPIGRPQLVHSTLSPTRVPAL